MGKSKRIAKHNNGMTITDDDGFEILGGDNKPLEVGEQAEGTFGGVVRSIPSKRKNEPPIPVYQIGSRTLIGSSVLKHRLEDGKVMPGDYLRVTRLEDGTAKKGQNAPKLYDVRVKRVISIAKRRA